MQLVNSSNPRGNTLNQLTTGWDITCNTDLTASDVVMKMAQYPDEEIQLQGCYRLNRLARQSEAQEVLDANGASAVAWVMKARQSSRELQEEGTMVLSCLVEVNSLIVRDAGGADALRAAQERYLDSKLIQYYAAQALDVMSRLPARAAREFNLQPEPEPASAEPEPEPEPEREAEPEPELQVISVRRREPQRRVQPTPKKTKWYRNGALSGQDGLQRIK